MLLKRRVKNTVGGGGSVKIIAFWVYLNTCWSQMQIPVVTLCVCVCVCVCVFNVRKLTLEKVDRGGVSMSQCVILNHLFFQVSVL